jgi:hypothetical protein
VKDYYFIDRNYEINMDLVIPKKSSFGIEKEVINVNVGDLVTIKEDVINYIGVVDTIEQESYYKFKLLSFDLVQIFNVDISVDNYSGNIGLLLKTIIQANYISCNDRYQAMSYLNIINNSNAAGELQFEEGKLIKVSTIIEMCYKNYAVVLKPIFTFIRGRISGLDLYIEDVSNKRIIKNQAGLIRNLIIKKNSNQSINKMIYIPNKENTTYKQNVEFFLLKDNTITKDSNHALRFEIPRAKSILFKDDEYSTIDVKAVQELKSSNYDHNVTFDIEMSNNLITPTVDFNVGDAIEFIDKDLKYQTIVTSIKYLATTKIATITLGEYRNKLTEKISILSKSITSNQSNGVTTIINNLDGGEF